MAFLTSAVADYLHNPSGLWEILILGLFKFIVNYGWRIVFFTVCLKILLLPLDLFQRFKMRKNQIITERLKPQLEKLQQQYAGDKQMLARKQMELNKKEGFSYFSSCLPMIVTLVIFFYLFAGLRNISQFMNLKQYLELYDTYTATVAENLDEKFEISDYGEISWNEITERYRDVLMTAPKEDDYKTEGEWDSDKGGEAAYKAAYDAWNESDDGKNARDLLRTRDEMENTYIKPVAQKAVENKYGETKESFLWVSNIWSPDVPWSRAILSHDSFLSNISNFKTYSKVKSKLKIKEDEVFNSVTYADMISESTYNNVMGALLAKSSPHNRVNGYLILPILSVALSFLSQFITTRLQKKSGQVAEGSMGGSMKMMMIIMPLMMGIFALSYTAMFTLYIVVNSAATILINVITTLAMNGKNKSKEKKLTTGVQKYGRPDPKDL